MPGAVLLSQKIFTIRFCVERGTKTLIKSLTAANRSERDRFFIPRSVQQSIPIRRIYSDGIWQVGRKHSRTWRFADVNYAAASEEERRSIFLSYGAVLNALPTDAAAKITIVNRRLDPEAFRRNILMRERGDTLDKYRREANEILVRRAAESNNLVQEKYITLSIVQRRIEESRAYFRRVDGNLSKSFGRLDSGAHLLSNHDRLRILHDFFRPGEEQYFTFDQTACIRRGMDFRDLICPDGMTFKAGHFEMGEKVGRVLFLKDYASYIKDDMISDLSDLSRSLMLSIDILPIPTDEAVRDVQNQIMGIETDITRWQQRQNDRNNFTASVPYELEQLRGETKEFLSDLTERDPAHDLCRGHTGPYRGQPGAAGRGHRDAAFHRAGTPLPIFYPALPAGGRAEHSPALWTAPGEGPAHPHHRERRRAYAVPGPGDPGPGGLPYGVNAISKNLLICDRKRLISPHAFYLGVTGLRQIRRHEVHYRKCGPVYQ